MKAHEGNRTLDLFLTKEVLYRLSYVGKFSEPTFSPCTQNGAGNGIRTRDPELGRLALYQLSYSRPRLRINLVERGGFEPPKATPADLQSAPFDRSGTSPCPIPSSGRPQNSHLSRWRESNSRPTDYKSVALPTELHRPRSRNRLIYSAIRAVSTKLYTPGGVVATPRPREEGGNRRELGRLISTPRPAARPPLRPATR